MPKRITYGIKSDIGQTRVNNEDAVFSLATFSDTSAKQPAFGVFIVADGMGGHQGGERASAIAARMVASHIQQEMIFPMLEGRGLEDIVEIIETAARKANEQVVLEVPEGGTTLTFAVFVDNRAFIGHVGDSRAYMISPRGITQLTESHDLVTRLIEMGEVTREQVASGEIIVKNVLYRALGQQEGLELNTTTRQLKPDEFLLICSDGLWNLVTDEVLQQTVLEAASPQEACQTLVDYANDKGGHDNISVIVVRVTEG